MIKSINLIKNKSLSWKLLDGKAKFFYITYYELKMAQ